MKAVCEYNNNSIEIINFTRYADIDGNPYNCTFTVNVVSNGFQGIAECECDYKKWLKFVDNLDKLYDFKINEVTLNDISYGSKVIFNLDNSGHLDISGVLYGEHAEQSLHFTFTADQTCLVNFIYELHSFDSTQLWGLFCFI